MNIEQVVQKAREFRIASDELSKLDAELQAATKALDRMQEAWHEANTRAYEARKAFLESPLQPIASEP